MENPLIHTRYREVQRPPSWIMILMVFPIGIAWWGFIEQILLHRPFGDNPGPDWIVWLVWVAVGIGVPFLVMRTRLIITVEHGDLTVRLAPFKTRQVPLTHIVGVEVRSYRPIREYGGWGIRYAGRQKGWVYSIRGKRGVFLTLRDDKRLLVGSAQPEKLSQVIEAGLPRRAHSR